MTLTPLTLSTPSAEAPEAAAEAPAAGAPWAVILGASSGTGAGIARVVALRQGFNVFGVHRGSWPELAAGLVAELRGGGREVDLWEADAGNAEAAALGAQRLLELAGPRSVRLFVHSIASAAVGPLAVGAAPLHPRQFEKTFDRMAHSFVYWAAELVRLDLLAPGARLIGLTNPMTEAVVRNAALVSASKAALECYVRHLAVELGPLGHRVNLVKFGLVVTEAVRRTFPGEAVERLEAVVRSMTPAHRLCTIEEVAELVGFLAGPHGRWFNGAVIDFTGGESLAMFDQLVYGAR